jgi:uncharacterized protein
MGLDGDGPDHSDYRRIWPDRGSSKPGKRRQKSSLDADFPFLSLDDFAVLRQALEQPEGLWAGTDRVILDEVQKAPNLLSAVKRVVDRAPGRVKFVLSGSANLMLMKQVSESLAGRAIYHVLDPLTLGEINQSAPPDFIQNILAGNWPKEGSLPAPLPDVLPGIQRG